MPSPPPLDGPVLSDTWSIIGLFQPFDGYITAAQAQADAGRYTLTWGTDKPAKWIAGNQRINATYYMAYDTDFDINIFGDLGHDLRWWQTGPHPDWVLYRCDRSTPAWVGGLPVNVPLDISNPQVVQYEMALVGPYMLANNYNAFAADVMSLTNGQGGCGVWTRNHTVWVNKFSGKPVDPKWAAATLYWAAYAQWYLHSLPVQIPFVANATNWSQPGDPAQEALVSHLDGLQDESGFTLYGNRMIDNGGFRLKIWWAQYIQSQGKAFLVTDLWKGSEPDNVQRDFAIATYLMGKEHQSAMVTAQYGSYGMEHYYPEYASAVGSPCGDMYPSGNVYLRKNTGSLVIVNASGSPVDVTLPKPASSYRDIEGRPVTDPLRVFNDDGWVLLTQNGCS